MPQIEIMQSDLPHTLYERRKSKGKKGKKKDANENFKFNPKDKAIMMQEEANRKMRERIASNGRQPGYTIEEIFKK